VTDLPANYHAQAHQDLIWHAQHNRGHNVGACIYARLLADETRLVAFYEATVLPTLEQHNFPAPPAGPGDGASEAYAAAVRDIVRNWSTLPRSTFEAYGI
jgi:hypothetical protein